MATDDFLVVVLRFNSTGNENHVFISYDSGNYLVRSLRSKMSQYFGKDAFTKGYIEIMDYASGKKVTVQSKEELLKLEGMVF